jgi:hypothetical protein
MNAQPLYRFVVLTSSLTTEQQVAYNSALTAASFAWAHHTTGGWLLATTDRSFSATQVRAMLRGAAPGVDCVVLEVEARDWAILLNSQVMEPATQWFRQYWEGSAPR